MGRQEESEVLQTRFQRFDWRLQVALIGWAISVAVLVLGLRVLDAHLLSIAP